MKIRKAHIMICTLLWLFSSRQALAAIAFTASSTAQSGDFAADWSATQTCSAGDWLIANVSMGFSSSGYTFSLNVNGSAATLLINSGIGISTGRNAVFSYATPTAGSNTVTAHELAGGDLNSRAVISAMCYSGVGSIRATTSANTATSTGASPSITFTSATGEVGVAFMTSWSGGSGTVASGQTLRSAVIDNATAASSSDKPGATSLTMGWTGIGNDNAVTGISLQPGGAAATPVTPGYYQPLGAYSLMQGQLYNP